ncbi:MAG: hypothetical protein ABSG68_21485 [Thermoguttaceae bacterium]|jgi:hypothetical protein
MWNYQGGSLYLPRLAAPGPARFAPGRAIATDLQRTSRLSRQMFARADEDCLRYFIGEDDEVPPRTEALQILDLRPGICAPVGCRLPE